jgi:hypothetical protein
MEVDLGDESEPYVLVVDMGVRGSIDYGKKNLGVEA